jgi:DNA-directed RNA polymerase specialized sigma24 family protein
MGFGSYYFFYKLRGEVEKTDGDGSIYLLLNQEVKKVVFPIISNQIPLEYVEDVYQDVFFSEWKNITSYIINMEHKTECQRLAWLITVANGRIADCYKKIKKLIRN